jgi:hypothetical protein
MVLTILSSALHFSFAPDGVVAQLVERLNGIQEVRGSNPLGSTILFIHKFIVVAKRGAQRI